MLFIRDGGREAKSLREKGKRKTERERKKLESIESLQYTQEQFSDIVDLQEKLSYQFFSSRSCVGNSTHLVRDRAA